MVELKCTLGTVVIIVLRIEQQGKVKDLSKMSETKRLWEQMVIRETTRLSVEISVECIIVIH